MSDGRGGVRDGAGRPKNSANKANEELRAMLDKIVDYPALLERMQQLSIGVLVEKTNVDGVKAIYKQKPDAKASEILLGYRYGKPAQAVDLTTNGESINNITVDIVENKGE